MKLISEQVIGNIVNNEVIITVLEIAPFDEGYGKIPESSFNAKGDVLAGTGSGAYNNVPVGTDGYVLSADSSEETGIKWVPTTAGGGEVSLTNKSGGTVIAGDVVITRYEDASSFDTSNVDGDGRVLGVAKETITNDSAGTIVIGGIITNINVYGVVNIGDWLVHSSTAKLARSAGVGKPEIGCIGIALTANASAGSATISALILPSTIVGNLDFSTDPDILIWLDASDASTLFTDDAGTIPAVNDSDYVGKWLDKSGNAKHLTQSNDTYKPLLKTAVYNGLNTVRLDGVSDYMVMPDLSLGGWTLLMVVMTAKNVSKIMIANNEMGIGFHADDYLMLAKTSGRTFHDTFWDSASLGIIGLMRLSATERTESRGYFNGVRVHEDTSNGWTDTGYYLGRRTTSGYNAAFDICELLIFDGLLSIDKFKAITNYLAGKWGVTVNNMYEY